MALHKEGHRIRMCADCAGTFEFDPENFNRTPDTHREAGDSCPTMYRG